MERVFGRVQGADKNHPQFPLFYVSPTFFGELSSHDASTVKKSKGNKVRHGSKKPLCKLLMKVANNSPTFISYMSISRTRKQSLVKPLLNCT